MSIVKEQRVKMTSLNGFKEPVTSKMQHLLVKPILKSQVICRLHWKMFPFQKAVAKWNSSPGIHGPKLNLKGLRNLGPEQDQRKVWHLEPDRTRTKTFFKFSDQLGSIVTQISRFVDSCSLQWSLDITCSVCSDQVMVSRRRRTSLFVSCPCLVDFRIFRKIPFGVCLLSVFAVQIRFVRICCPYLSVSILLDVRILSGFS